MRKEELTIEEVMYWQDRYEKLKKSGKFTKQAWCDLGHELMEKHSLSEQDAVLVLHGKVYFDKILQTQKDTKDVG